MRKLVLLWILILAGCSSGSTVINEEPNRENETVESAENAQTNPVTVLEDFDSVEEWLIDRLFAQAEDHYVDFRLQGQWVFGPSPHKVYFDNNHSVRVAPKSIQLGNINILEDMELVGQSLSLVPHAALSILEEVVVSEMYIEPRFNNGRLIVSVEEMLSQLGQGGLFEVVMNFYITSVNHQLQTHGLSSEAESYLSRKALLSPMAAMSEAYWLQVMVNHNLLTAEEEQRFNEFLLDEYAKEVVEFYQARDFDASTLPPHRNPDISMYKFYQYIYESDPSTYMGLVYKGTGVRHHERVVRPDWCMHNSQCESEVDWQIDYPYEVHIFEAEFSNVEPIEFLMTTNVSQATAEEQLSKLAFVHGQMPRVMLLGLQGVLLVEGTGGAWGGPYNGYHTIQAACDLCNLFEFDGLATLVLHELAHATLDADIPRPDHIQPGQTISSLGLVNSDRRDQAAALDGVFVSKYAEDFPDKEDIAETVTLYVAARYYSDRLGPVTADALRRFLPHRFALLDEVFDEFNQ